MGHSMSNWGFSAMSFLFAIRDLISPRSKILEEVRIQPGSQILDFGCGPGSYALVAAEITGSSGKVFALDMHPLAVRSVSKKARRKGISNIVTIQSDCGTGLEDCSIDVVLLYDTFHDLHDPHRVLAELHRVLKPDGLLSFNDHHLKEDTILSGMTSSGLFRHATTGRKTYTFSPVKEE